MHAPLAILVLCASLAACGPKDGAPPAAGPTPSASTGAAGKPTAPARPRAPLVPETVGMPIERTLLKLSPDKVVQCVDFYPTLADIERTEKPGPIVVMLHGLGRSRAELKPAARRLQRMGVAALAVDLRSGGEFGGVVNRTAAQFEKDKGRHAEPSEDYDDIGFAIARARESAPRSKVALLGTGHSAALALLYAAREPKAVECVFAFSPGEDFGDEKIAPALAHLAVPAYVTCGPGEEARIRPFLEAIPKSVLTSFVPPADVQSASGIATLMVEKSADRDRQWETLADWLEKLKP